MCGIFGIFGSNSRISRETLDAAVGSLTHRGPDDCGTAVINTDHGELGLAHTRLSIIDLSPLGHQPMHDPATGNCIVFNGEIYNFRELRSQLEFGGNRFVSHSDTEVILAAYRSWGEESFSRLRGMFAFALWDAGRQRLLLVRDPLGIKPLYYAQSNQHFLFASEVRALLNTGLIPRKLDPDGLFSFLAFGSVYEPQTIVEGISAIAPGQVASLEDGRFETREFWSLPEEDKQSETSSTDESIRRLPGLLRDAVVSHLVSDVPVGVFLSGGIDSSSLVAIMRQAGVRPSTFSLVFREEEFDEAEHSRLIAQQFSTDHHEIMVSENDALASLPEALRSMDQPTIDGVNTWLVSSKTRAAGVKVALTGLGADEMFAGYSNFRRVPQMEKAAARLAKLPSLVREPVAASISLMGRPSDRNRKLFELAAGSAGHPYFLARSLFTPDERKALYDGDYEAAECNLQTRERDLASAARNLDPVNRVSYLESTCYMRNTLLRDSDFMSMAHGLELRVPFLDRALVEACFRIPGNEKLLGDSPKNLLLRGLRVKLPKEVVNRPKKGFTLPFEKWLRSEMKSHVEQALRDQSMCWTGLKSQAPSNVWQRFLKGETSWSRPWSLFVLQQWCEQNL
jgi:asparagine synthase (glutamine-hydrolysing)